MEEQLKSIQSLLRKLVDGNNQAGSTGIFFKYNGCQYACHSASVIWSTHGCRQHFIIIYLNSSPIVFDILQIFIEGMQFLDYKQKVKVWRKLVTNSIPAEKYDLLQFGELTVTDKYSIVLDALGLEIQSKSDGADELKKEGKNHPVKMARTDLHIINKMKRTRRMFVLGARQKGTMFSQTVFSA